MIKSELLHRLRDWYRRRLRLWLRQNPRLLKLLRRFSCFSVEREALARGLAVGLFFGLTPTVGIQTMLVLLTCFLLRANFPLAFAATWISNPLTVGALYYAFHEVGEYLSGASAQVTADSGVVGLMLNLTEEAGFMLLGSLVIATPVAVLGYLALHQKLKPKP